MMNGVIYRIGLIYIWAIALLLTGCELERGVRNAGMPAPNPPALSSQPAWADPARLERGKGEFSVAGIEKVPSKYGDARWLNMGVVRLDSARYHRYRVFIRDDDELSSARIHIYVRDTVRQGQFVRLSGDYPARSLEASRQPLPPRFMHFYVESYDLEGDYQAVPASLGGLILRQEGTDMLEGSLNVAKAEDTVLNYAVAIGGSFRATPSP